MNTGIDLFIADLPGLEYGYGDGVFKPHCEEHGGVLTTPLSKSELDAILEVDTDSSCQYMSIAAYGAGDYPDDLTFYTDDSSQAQELIYANWLNKWGVIMPEQPTSAGYEYRCTYMNLLGRLDPFADDEPYVGFWSNVACDMSENQCGLCRASPSGGGGGGKLAFLPT